MIHGHCCRCNTSPDPPGDGYENDCTAKIFRNTLLTPSPESATASIATEPGTEWYEWFDNAFPAGWRWRSDISALHTPTTGDPTPKTILVAPLRFTANYPADGGEWGLGSLQGSNFHWDVTDGAFAAGQNRSMYSEGGAFDTYSHIWPGQKISEGTVPLEDYPIAKRRQIRFNRIRSNYHYNPGGFGSPYTWMARIRYVSLNGAEPVDLIPTEYEHDFANGPQCGIVIGGTQPYGWPGYDYGLWKYDIPISFSGGSMTWDIWIELHGTVPTEALPYLSGSNARVRESASGGTTGYDRSSVEYELQVLKSWKNLTPEDNGEDWQFTFTGGDAPTDGTETISISDMTDRERTSCYVIGRFTWGGIWVNTTFQLSFYWDREVPVIALISLASDEEFGPYNTGIEGYVPTDTVGATPISSWTINAVDAYGLSGRDHYSVQTPRGTWSGNTQTFTLALDGQSQVGSFADPFDTGEWPSQVTVTKVARTTQ